MAGAQQRHTFLSNCGCCVPRRSVLKGLGAVAAGSLFSATATTAQAPSGGRIDLHRHFVPPGYVVDKRRQYLNDRSTVSAQLEEMDKSGIASAVISITGPELVVPTGEAGRKFARLANDFCASLGRDHRGRFGQFATLPFPDVDGCLREIEYAFDTLKADGAFLRTNYDRTFLGDDSFAPVFEELNRRKAVLYTHPAGHPCCERIVPGLRDADIEYGTNTTRAIAKFIFSGSSRKYPDMRVIWSHAGGTMPFLIRRFDKRVRESPEFQPVLPDGFSAEARKQFYEIAQAPERAPMAALKAVAPVSQILFGTDWPHLTSEEHIAGLKACGVFDDAELRAIDRDNALRLLPSLARA